MGREMSRVLEVERMDHDSLMVVCDGAWDVHAYVAGIFLSSFSVECT